MNRVEYEELLPYGYKSAIAKRAGCTRQTVSAFFKGRSKSKKIEDAILEILAELKLEREEKMRNAGLI